MATRVAVSGPRDPGSAAPRRRRPDVPARRRRGLARHPYADRAGDPAGAGLRARRRGARRRLGAGRRLGARPPAGDARRRRRPGRVRAAPPARRRGVATAPVPPVRREPPGARGAGACRHRAEGHRSGGVRRLPPAASTGTASARPARVATCGCGSSRTRATLRRVPSWEWLRMHIDPARSRAVVRAATGGRQPRAADPRRRRRQAAHAARHRRVDVRRGALARSSRTPTP